MMFSDLDMTLLNHLSYAILHINHHDVTMHSTVTGHDWIVVSSYGARNCYILHRHSGRDSYHRQGGNYKTLNEAIKYINRHEKWFAAHKMKLRIDL